MLSIIITLLPIFCIMGIGIFAERRQMLPRSTAFCMNQFVYWFSLPLLVFYQMARMRPEQILPAAAGGFVLGSALAYALSYWVQRGLKDEGKACYMTAMVGTFTNSAFMGLPIVFLLMPDDSVAAVAAGIAVVLTSGPMLFTDTMLGLRFGQAAQGLNAEEGTSPQVKKTGPLRNIGRALIRNPVLVCTAVGAMAGLSNTKLPDAVLTTAHMIGNTAAPCALFCMGMTLSAQVEALAGKPWGKLQRQISMALFKLALTPLLVFLTAWVLGERGVALGSITLMAAMPTAVVGYIIAERYDAAAQDCSTGIVINTVLSTFSIPVVIMLLRWGGALPQ